MNPFRWIQRRVTFWNDGLRSITIGPIRANWILITVCGIGFVAAVVNLVERARQHSEPQIVELSTLFSATGAQLDYVEVTGLLFPETHITFPAGAELQSGVVRSTYVAMTDDDVKRVLLVRFRGDLGEGEPRHATITGLLVPPDAPVLSYFKSKDAKIAGLSIERRYVLFAGTNPVPVWLFPLVIGLLLLFSLPWVLAEIRCLRTKQPQTS